MFFYDPLSGFPPGFTEHYRTGYGYSKVTCHSKFSKVGADIRFRKMQCCCNILTGGGGGMPTGKQEDSFEIIFPQGGQHEFSVLAGRGRSLLIWVGREQPNPHFAES